MTKPVFMSPEHVAQMNARLAEDIASRAQCAALRRRYQVAYELQDGGSTVWWTMSFDREQGVRFALAPPEGIADLLFSGGYRAMLDFMRRSKAGQASPVEMPLTFSGDPGAYALIAGAFASAQAAATLDAEIPEA